MTSTFDAKITAAVLVLLASFATTGCKQEGNLTRVPGIATVEREQRPAETTLFLAVPIDVAAVKSVAEAAIGERVAKWRTFMEDIACDKRKGPWTECNGAVVSMEMVRAGAIDVAVDGGRLQLVVPLKYEIAAKGHGWASYLTDEKTGQTSVRIPIDATIASGYRLDVRVAGEPVWSDKSISILKGKIILAQSGDAKLKADLKAASEPLRKALADQGLQASAERAWRALHTPLALMRSPDLWLKGEPQRVLGGGFAREGGDVVYRIGVSARVSVHQGERPRAATYRALPEPSRQAEAQPRTRLLFPVDFSATALVLAIQAAFPANEMIETKADNKAEPVKVKTRSIALHPSKDMIAIEMKLDVVEPRRMHGMIGTAYFMARPVMNAETGLLQLDDIGFPAPPPKDAKAAKAEFVRIGEEPFAGRIAVAGQLAIGDQIKSLLPRINAAVEQRLDDTLELRGAFDALNILTVDPKRDAFRVTMELSGSLTLKVIGPAAASRGAMQRTDAVGAVPMLTGSTR